MIIMADENITKADIDKAVKDALASAREEFDTEVTGLKDKNKELLGKLRAAGEIKPEDLATAEDRAEKAEKALADANKQVAAITKERDGAVKALETEQGAARSYALDAELSGAIAEGNVLPAFVPALKAMLQQQAKADLVDGKYIVQIGDKPARDHMKAFLDSDDGKHFRAADQSGGGGRPGSGGAKGDGGKQMGRSAHQALTLSNAKQANDFILTGGVVVNDPA